jgi:hypothetical protein
MHSPKVLTENALPWLLFKKILDVFYTNKKELNRPEYHVTITYTVKKLLTGTGKSLNFFTV